MYTTLATLIDRLDSTAVAGTEVIPWGSPVPAFGDPASARVATLGLNPSNREFLDERGVELGGTRRRFHTLGSLGLASWSEADSRHIEMILATCCSYFRRNPYDRWFRVLEEVVGGCGVSYYRRTKPACHLDLIPFATRRKWTELSPRQRSHLLSAAGDTLGLLLRDSAIRVLVLNGATVVEHFQAVTGVSLEKVAMRSWSLPRHTRPHVNGYAYSGEVTSISGVRLGRGVRILGYNHNLQSSYGVTREVIGSIRRWIAAVSGGVTQ